MRKVDWIRIDRKLLILGRLVGFETTAGLSLRITYRKQIAENTLVAIFAVAHCPGLPWLLQHWLEREARIGVTTQRGDGERHDQLGHTLARS
jgi:hypothetical protein